MNRLLIAPITLLFFLSVFCPGLSYSEISDGLRTAIVIGDIESVKRFIGEGANINKVYDDNSTPLLEAIEKSSGSSDIVTLLLQYGANPALKPSGSSPLSAALRINNEEIIKLLSPYAVDDRDFYGLALFHWDRNEDTAAFDYADKATKLNPSNYDAWSLKGAIFCSQKNMKDAVIAYRHAFNASLENLKANKSADVYTTAVWYAILSGDFAGAQRLANEALSLFPKNGLIAMNMGHAELFLGNKKEAMAFYKKSYNTLKQSDQYGDQAAQQFLDDFSYLRERYPDKRSLIGWAEKRLLEPFDFPYGETPFGEEKNSVLDLFEGADIRKESPVVGTVDPIFKKLLGEGLYTLDVRSQLSPTAVEKYSIAYDKWDTIERIDLFFTALPGGGDHGALFFVGKHFKEQQGKLESVFTSMQENFSKECSAQPAVHDTSMISPSGPLPTKIAVWKLNDATVILDVVNVSASTVQSSIVYLSKKGWEQYLNSLRVNKTQ